MRTIQVVLQKVLSAWVLAIGVVLIGFRKSDIMEWGWAYAIVRGLDGRYIHIAIGAALTLIGLLALLPLMRLRRKDKVIRFPGTHGEVVIQLDSVEASLNRVIGKVSGVKKISVNVVPTEDASKVRIAANVWLYKDAGSSARGLADRISESIGTTAANILGLEEVAVVDLNVRGIVLDSDQMRTPAPQAPAPSVEPVQAEPERPEPASDSLVTYEAATAEPQRQVRDTDESAEPTSDKPWFERDEEAEEKDQEGL